VFVGAIEMRAPVLGDFERHAFVFARDAEKEIVEASGQTSQAKSVSGPS